MDHWSTFHSSQIKQLHCHLLVNSELQLLFKETTHGMPLYCLNCFTEYENPSAKCVICPEEPLSDSSHVGWCTKCFNQRLEKLKTELSKELQEKVHNLTNFMKRKGKPTSAPAAKKGRLVPNQRGPTSNTISLADGEEDIQILAKTAGESPH